MGLSNWKKKFGPPPGTVMTRRGELDMEVEVIGYVGKKCLVRFPDGRRRSFSLTELKRNWERTTEGGCDDATV